MSAQCRSEHGANLLKRQLGSIDKPNSTLSGSNIGSLLVVALKDCNGINTVQPITRLRNMICVSSEFKENIVKHLLSTICLVLHKRFQRLANY